MIAFITALFLTASVPSQPTDLAPKQTAIVFKDQQVFYNLSSNKKRK